MTPCCLAGLLTGRDGGVGTAQLERPGGLQRLGLDQERRLEPGDRDQRRADRHPLEPTGRIPYFGQADQPGSGSGSGRPLIPPSLVPVSRTTFSPTMRHRHLARGGRGLAATAEPYVTPANYCLYYRLSCRNYGQMPSRPRNAELISRNLGRKYSFSAKLEGHSDQRLKEDSRRRLNVDGNNERLLTPGEVAALFRVDPKTVYPLGGLRAASRASEPRGGTAGSVRSEVRALLRGDSEPSTARPPGGLTTP